MFTMRRLNKRVQTRYIAAVVLICASFISAYVLSSMANRTVLLWSAKTYLVPGSVISQNDLVAKQASIPGGSDLYISARNEVSNFLVVKAISPGELLPLSALSASSKAQQMSAVPVSVHTSDIPVDLQIGETVNLYHVGDPHLTNEIGPPSLVLSHAYILGIDRKAQNLGADITLTISVAVKSIVQMLDATASGRVVVVRVHG